MQDLYLDTVKKIGYLRKEGFNIIEMWECNLKRELERDEEMRYYFAEKENIRIEHVRNGGEERLKRYSMDGYHRESNTVYEFQGCLWHGK